MRCYTTALLTGLCLYLTGCASFSTVEPLGGGYQEVTYTRDSFSEPQAHQITLQYRKPDTRWIRGTLVMIWPSVSGDHVKNDVAVFVGEAASRRPDPDNRRATESRLFAVRFPDCPLDITDEVLCRWAQQSGADFTAALKSASIVYPEATDDSVVFHFANGLHKDIDFRLDWNQIADVMRTVKESGVVRQDRVWGLTYLEKDFHK